MSNGCESLLYNTDKFERAAHEVGKLVTSRMLQQDVVVVGIAGGSATGKTETATPFIADVLETEAVISEDSYCLGQSWSHAKHGYSNLHAPGDYDPARMRADLEKLKQGFTIKTPVYSYTEREPLQETREIKPARVVLVEGCYLLQPVIKEVLDVTLFVNADDHSRFIRRLLRPRRSQNQSDTERIRDYITMTYPSYYTETAAFADAADVTVDNPYSPTEHTINLVAPCEKAVRDIGAVISRQVYDHPNMTEQEQLYVDITADGIQVLAYAPNGASSPAVSFHVPLDEYRIDLGKVGYSPL